jgi:Holliday junction DNA helicase RuvB
MLDNYIGQDRAIAQLKAEMHVAKETGSTLPHMLILGEPGTGKTTLAQRMSEEMDRNFAIMHCPNITSREEVVGRILEAEGGILFCEEIHALRRDFAEDMYTVIDENTVTVPSYGGSVLMDPDEPDPFLAFRLQEATNEPRKVITPLTVIGATTDEAMLAPAFLSRLSGLTVRLEPYTIEALRLIAFNYAVEQYKVQIEWDAAQFLADRSRLNPRRVKQLVDRAYAHYFTDKYNKITLANAQAAVQAVGIDEKGLEAPHRKMLGFLAESGLSRTSLAQRMGIPAKNVDLYFGELVRLGMATIGRKHEITGKGRQAYGG